MIPKPSLGTIAGSGGSNRLGFPCTPSHIRDWTTGEFRNFVSRYLDVVAHVITDVAGHPSV